MTMRRDNDESSDAAKRPEHFRQGDSPNLIRPRRSIGSKHFQ